MALIVQKYGGTSVSTIERIFTATRRIIKTVQAGHSVVVVVSAMGNTTDELLSVAKQIATNPPQRELDLLLTTGEQVSSALMSMALQSQGQPAIALTGMQVSIITEANHTRARILHVETKRLRHHLGEGKVIIIAGFQGISSKKDLEVTTLGRGGSDTTAVAIAAALEANLCEIYTDVSGIFTTDPRIVREAQVLEKITCEEMLELASLGAKVLHPRAVEIAYNYGIPVVVCSSLQEGRGTLVVPPPFRRKPGQDLEIFNSVSCVKLARDLVKVTLLNVTACTKAVVYIFEELAAVAISVDLIVRSSDIGNINEITFTVHRCDAPLAVQIVKTTAVALGEFETVVTSQVAKVSIVGAGMIGRPGVAAQMFAALEELGINSQLISTSEIKISCIINAEDGDKAALALCQSFGVDYSVEASPSSAKNLKPSVRGVALDESQVRLTVIQVPNIPGYIAQLFQTLAQERISVDVIVQSQDLTKEGEVSTRNIHFSVAQEDAYYACRALEPLIQLLGCGSVIVDNKIAKVSVVGIGIAKQPSITTQIFHALTNVGIDIKAIATSESKISCWIAKSDGVKALQSLHRVFNLEQVVLSNDHICSV
ncbi:aspartate kinase [Nostoc commune]|uniref:aspartate kinase n=1 Tax=Nostoc commune TaxID=1178 RepID=UPI0018C6C22F|nr:aspartate kinase [Nostoc commune]MBG1261350.1 aspartate kinase [Nostoc commune BAE]